MLDHLRPANLLRLPAWLLQWLPASCALCGQAGRSALCEGCQRQYFTLRPRRCIQCAMPIRAAAKDPRCGSCLKDKPAFDTTIVAADYLAPVDQLVLALKFGNRLTLAPLLAAMLADALRQQVRSAAMPALLMAVPLGPRRLQERGFNQSLEIARPLAHRLDIPLAPQLLVRVRDTLAQSTLPADERQRNMRKAFVVPSAAMNHVRGRHIGVVDDVITTGETLGEIAATLKRFGARRVTNIVFSRAISK